MSYKVITYNESYSITSDGNISTENQLWDFVPGLCGETNTVSFERNGKYLRHCNYNLQFDENDGSALMKLDASFNIRDSKWFPNTVSFESVNFPGHFIRHLNHRMAISTGDDTDSFNERASWEIFNAEGNRITSSTFTKTMPMKKPTFNTTSLSVSQRTSTQTKLDHLTELKELGILSDDQYGELVSPLLAKLSQIGPELAEQISTIAEFFGGVLDPVRPLSSLIGILDLVQLNPQQSIVTGIARLCFKIADVDGNGLLDRGEFDKVFVAMCSQLKKKSPTPEEIEIQYKQCDLDGNGYLDLEEWTAFCMELFLDIAPPLKRLQSGPADCSISWYDDERYWTKQKSSDNLPFGVIAKLNQVCWFDIRTNFRVPVGKYDVFCKADCDDCWNMDTVVEGVRDPMLSVGMMIEVLDTVSTWYAATILKVADEIDGDDFFGPWIFIHYEGWTDKWNEWLNLEDDKHRIRPCDTCPVGLGDFQQKREDFDDATRWTEAIPDMAFGAKEEDWIKVPQFERFGQGELRSHSSHEHPLCHAPGVSLDCSDAYYEGFICNMCRASNPTPRRWWCIDCQYDLCTECMETVRVTPSVTFEGISSIFSDSFSADKPQKIGQLTITPPQLDLLGTENTTYTVTVGLTNHTGSWKTGFNFHYFELVKHVETESTD